MVSLPGYEIEREIHRGTRFLILAGRRLVDGQSVVIKTFREALPAPRDIARLKQEQELTGSLPDLNQRDGGIIRVYDLEEYRGNYYLILENIDGVSLKQHVADRSMDLRRFLRIAVRLTETLAGIHAAGIIHKDLKPANIIINPDADLIRITDFGIATRIRGETTTYSPAGALEGTLAYISPEQTGRMNRAVDYRSDLYSVGVTFFEMLAGRRPFDAQDPMKLVHAHIALAPPRLEDAVPGTPKVLSDIVARLLRKNAEERYQSAAGLKSDLLTCLEKLTGEREIAFFEIGREDYSGRFQVQQKLYGREKETRDLMASYERAAAGSAEIMLVSGYSGVGKSALVNEVHKPITGHNGLFIAGKFDQFQRDVPYYAISQAFNELCSYLAAQSSEVLERWREKIRTAAGDQGGVLTDIVPDLELIIGKQTPVPELGSAETINRLNAVFRKLMHAVCDAEHPLVMFIDDLQWVDSGSLLLLKHILESPDLKHFLLIGAYRDNEVDAKHPWALAMQEFQEKGIRLADVRLEELSPGDIRNLLSDALNHEPEQTGSLADLTLEKTRGNAFFVKEFLKSLADDELLKFDFESRSWGWDMEAIREKKVTDNVVDLMANRIDRQEPDTRKALQLAACMGNKFSLHLLSIIHEKARAETLRDLWPAIQEGLLLPLDANYKVIAHVSADTIADSNQTMISRFKFPHDRVQEAAYSTIPSEQTGEIHLRIARLLMRDADEGELEERIFDIVHQYSNGLEGLVDASEKIRVAELCLRANEKAMKSSAFRTALSFCETAAGIIDELDVSHELNWRLLHNRAACEYSCALLEQCEQTILKALVISREQDEYAAIYQIYQGVLFQMNRHMEGIEATVEGLRLLGLNVRPSATKVHVAAEYVKFRLRLGRRRADELLNLPDVSDRRIYNICAILYDAMPSTYMAKPDMMGYLSVIMANLCLRYGKSKYAPFAFGMVALVMSGVTRETTLGREFSDMSLAMSENYSDTDIRGRVNFLAGNFVHHWIRPVRDHLPLVNTALRLTRESGNLNWAVYSLFFCRSQSIFWNTKRLAQIIEDNEAAYELFFKFKDREVYMTQIFIVNFLRRMAGMGDAFLPAEAEFELEPFLGEFINSNNYVIRGYIHLFRMVEAYEFGEYEKALPDARTGSFIVQEALGMMLDPIQRFYYQMTVLAAHDNLGGWERLKLMPMYRLNRFMFRKFAREVPENFGAHHELILAEEARVKKSKGAMEAYERALAAADQSEFPHIGALAYERAALFHLSVGHLRIASVYLKRSLELHEARGARAKVKYLRREYADLLRADPADASPAGDKTGTTSTTGVFLDPSSILKAAGAISGEIKLEPLLRKITSVLMENVGARRGVLLMRRNGKLRVEIEGRLDAGEQEYRVIDQPMEEFSELPARIVEFAVRTGESKVVDGLNPGEFGGDEYVKKSEPPSMLCVPIANGARSFGVVYLENDLARDAFTKERLKIAGVLCGQAAVSLENALIYDRMERKVDERAREVRDIMRNVRHGLFVVERDLALRPIFSHPLPRLFPGVSFERVESLRIGDLIEHPLLESFLNMLFDSPFVSDTMVAAANPVAEYCAMGSRENGEGVTRDLSISFARIREGEAPDAPVRRVMVVVEERGGGDTAAEESGIGERAEDEPGLGRTAEPGEDLRATCAREAGELNKRVRLEFENRLPDPLPSEVWKPLNKSLEELVRNSVRHGIEKERTATGKPSEGRILVRLEQDADHVHAVCEDDGGGLDYGAIRARAVSMGVLNDESAGALPDKKVAALIFREGLSTGDGAGAGLGRVRNDLRKLGAVLRIKSETGKRTRFLIKIPRPGRPAD